MKFRAILDDKYDLEEKKQFSLKPWHTAVIFFAAITAVLNLLAVIYVRSGKAIFFWDNATYWDISRRILSGEMSRGGFWHNIYASIAAEDYNYVAALPTAALMKIFGPSRLVYVTGLVNMYLVPSCIMIYMLAKKISKAPKIATALTIIILPCMTFLAFAGFVDIGALLICLIIYTLYYQSGDEPRSLWRYLSMGALLVLAVIWRRYFAFFAVSFITAMIADCVLLRRRWYGALITALTAAAILIFCFGDFVTQKLMADYGTLYADYKFSFGTDIKLITRYFGIIYLFALLVSSVAMGAAGKEYRQMFPWIQAIVCLVMFISTQTHGQQHLLLYIPELIILTLLVIKHITKEWMLLAISSLAILHAVFVYIPREQPHNIQEIKRVSLIPTFSMISEARTDTDEILAFKRKIDTTVYEGDTLGVLASSFKLNEDIFRNVEASLGIKPIRENYIVSLPQVDSRDRDLTPLYTVNYVLAAIPAETHLAEGSQTVITEAVKSFENYADIATAYEEIADCETEIDGVTLKLYHRVREVTAAEISEFQSRLYK